jgi:hypothetical protein
MVCGYEPLAVHYRDGNQSRQVASFVPSALLLVACASTKNNISVLTEMKHPFLYWSPTARNSLSTLRMWRDCNKESTKSWYSNYPSGAQYRLHMLVVHGIWRILRRFTQVVEEKWI